MIVDGKQQYLFDEKGRRYLDVSWPTCWLACRLGCWLGCWLGRPGQWSGAAPAPLLVARPGPPAMPRLQLLPVLPPAPVAPRTRPLLNHLRPSALQAFAGIVTVSVGHCHPEVNKAVIEQTHRLQVLRPVPRCRCSSKLLHCWLFTHGIMLVHTVLPRGPQCVAVCAASPCC